MAEMTDLDRGGAMIERIMVSPEIVIDVFGGADPHLIMVVNDRAGGHLVRIDQDVIEALIEALGQAGRLVAQVEHETR